MVKMVVLALIVFVMSVFAAGAIVYGQTATPSPTVSPVPTREVTPTERLTPTGVTVPTGAPATGHGL